MFCSLVSSRGGPSTPQRNNPIFGSQRVHPNSKTPYSDALKFMGAKKEAFVYHNGHVKRPMNAFMVWSQMERQIIQNEILSSSPDNPRVIHNSEISCQLGKLWARLTEEERRPYVQEAERMRVLHLKQFPSYKYRPRKRSRQEEVDTDDDVVQPKSKPRQGTMIQAKDFKKSAHERTRQNCSGHAEKCHDFETMSSPTFRLKNLKENVKEKDDTHELPCNFQSGSTKKRGRKVFSAVLSSTGALSKLKVFEIIRQNCSNLEKCRNRSQEVSDEDALADETPMKGRLTLKIRINEKLETATQTASASDHQGLIDSPTLPDDRVFGFSPSKPVGTDSFLYSGQQEAYFPDEGRLIGVSDALPRESLEHFNLNTVESTFDAKSDHLTNIFSTALMPDYQLLESTNEYFHDDCYPVSDSLPTTSNTINSSKPYKSSLSEDLEAIEFPTWWKNELSEVDVNCLLQDVQDFDDFPIISFEDLYHQDPFTSFIPLNSFQINDMLESY